MKKVLFFILIVFSSMVAMAQDIAVGDTIANPVQSVVVTSSGKAVLAPTHARRALLKQVRDSINAIPFSSPVFTAPIIPVFNIGGHGDNLLKIKRVFLSTNKVMDFSEGIMRPLNRQTVIAIVRHFYLSFLKNVFCNALRIGFLLTHE